MGTCRDSHELANLIGSKEAENRLQEIRTLNPNTKKISKSGKASTKTDSMMDKAL